MDDKNFSKNVRSTALILFVTVVVLVACINSSNVFPWVFIGLVILAISLPLQRSEKFADFREHIARTLNSFRRWNDLNEKEKFYRSLWVSFPLASIFLLGKDPILAGAAFIFLIWDAFRHLRKWQRLQDEEKL